MAQFARPDGDITTGNWEDTTGGDSDSALWDEIDESTADDGTTYIHGTSTATALEVSLTTVTDPGVDTGHVARFRAYAVGSGAPERVDFSLVQGTTVIAVLNNQGVTEDSWNTYTLTVAEAEAANITDYTDLRLRWDDVVIGSGETIDITWAELEVPDASVTHDGIATVAGTGAVAAGAALILNAG